MVVQNNQGSVAVEFGWSETISKKMKLFEQTFLLHFSKQKKMEEKVPMLFLDAKEVEKKEKNRNSFINTKCAGDKYCRIKGRTIRYIEQPSHFCPGHYEYQTGQCSLCSNWTGSH